ncbi:MAG: molybdenum cofactor guanylyltransferase [Dehalococcoidia bacterium]
MTAIVLAGGKSSRLGRDKALEKIGGRYLIERVIGSLSQLGDDIIVVTAAPNQLSDLNVEKVIDTYPRTGAKVGLCTGINASLSFYSLVVACDMPFLNIDLLRYLLDSASGFDAVIPRIGDKIEPLHAVYSKNCIPVLEEQIRKDKLKISDLFSEINVRYVEAAEIERYDQRHLSLFNINSEADLKRAKAIIEKESHD